MISSPTAAQRQGPSGYTAAMDPSHRVPGEGFLLVHPGLRKKHLWLLHDSFISGHLLGSLKDLEEEGGGLLFQLFLLRSPQLSIPEGDVHYFNQNASHVSESREGGAFHHARQGRGSEVKRAHVPALSSFTSQTLRTSLCQAQGQEEQVCMISDSWGSHCGEGLAEKTEDENPSEDLAGDRCQRGT